MPETSDSTWFGPFVVAAVVGGLLVVALTVSIVGRRRMTRSMMAALGPQAAGAVSPVLAARRAAAESARHDAALAELRAIVEAAPFGIVALDRLGRVLTMNPAAARMLGLPVQHVSHKLLIELVRSQELDALLKQATETQRPAEAELSFLSAGTRRIARAVAAPLATATTDASCVVVLEEITELRRLEAVRSDFVANVSHELRTPITNLRGYAETLQDEFELDPQARKFVEIIQRNATRLSAIIDDLLLLASLEGAPTAEPVEMTPVPIQAVIAEGVEQHADAAARKSMRVECDCAPGLVTLGSAGLLSHAVGNLIGNAVKYSPPESVVRVVARKDADQVVIEVHDQGPGVPAQHLPRIFERFYRVDKARSRESGGTGLGLAIVKHVAQTHGGTVEVESRTGAGSCFRLRLPTASGAPHEGSNQIPNHI